MKTRDWPRHLGRDKLRKRLKRIMKRHRQAQGPSGVEYRNNQMRYFYCKNPRRIGRPPRFKNEWRRAWIAAVRFMTEFNGDREAAAAAIGVREKDIKRIINDCHIPVWMGLLIEGRDIGFPMNAEELCPYIPNATEEDMVSWSLLRKEIPFIIEHQDRLNGEETRELLKKKTPTGFSHGEG